MSSVVTLPRDLSGGDREVQTLFADSSRRLVMIRLRNRSVLVSHPTAAPITIQCLVGAGVLWVGQDMYQLEAGVIVPVDAHIEHRVQADPEVALLVTFFHQLTAEPSGVRRVEPRYADERLRETEERYRTLIENARDVIFTLSVEGVFTSLNPIFEEATGWSPEEWIGKPFSALLHPDDLPTALTLWRRILHGEIPPLFEVRLASKGGAPIEAELLVTPHLHDGQVVSVFGIARNVTERKRIEEEQRRAEVAEAARQVLETEVADRKRIEGQLRYRLVIEEVLAHVSRIFALTADPDFTHILKILGAAVGANRAYLFLKRGDHKLVDNTHEWCDEETETWKTRLQGLDPADFPWWVARMAKGETIAISDTETLPEEAVQEKAICRIQGVKAFLAVPIQSRGGRLIGFLGFDVVKTPRVWLEEDVRLLRVVSEMLSSVIARNQAEAALRAAERDYRAIFENAVEGIYRSSLAGRQLRANPALVKLNGYDSEEEMLPAVNDIATEWYVDPHRRKEFTRILEEQGTVIEFESEVYRHKTRERIWISETARLVRNDNGLPLYYEGTVQDITARKRVEEALHEREARLAAIFRTVSDVIVTFDLDHVITGVNRAIERVLGYKPEEVIGRSTDILTTPGAAALARNRTRQALQGEVLPTLFEVQGQHKNGTLMPLEGAASFLYEDGRPVGVVGVLRDISLKKELERQRADFLAMLTHDIKNPMHAILGYAELLLDDAVNGEQQKLLQRLRENALTVHSLVTNYLDFSKVESGHLALVRQPVGINLLLQRIEQLYAGEAFRRDITLRMYLQEGLPLIDGDPLALERVFANLLHNALKFTPRLGVVVIRSAVQTDAVTVTFTDSGPGIAQEELASLFEKYRRAKQVRASDGAGLGLFIVKALVEEHGGQVQVESAPGQGACFSVLLPIASPIVHAT